MARRHKKEEHVNNERWLVSYADFITLLFAFFTSLYAISTVDARKAGKMVFSTRAAFNMDFFRQEKPVLGYPTPGRPSLKDAILPDKRVLPGLPQSDIQPSGATESSRKIRRLAKDLERYVDLRGLGSKMKVRILRDQVIVSLAAAAFFDSGEATVKAESLPALDTIAEKLLDTTYELRIEGHTDDRPPYGGKYRSNWELSTARAVSVVRYLLEEFAYPAANLSAAGYASHRPVADNGTEDGRAANRRVDLVLENPRQLPAVN